MEPSNEEIEEYFAEVEGNIERMKKGVSATESIGLTCKYRKNCTKNRSSYLIRLKSKSDLFRVKIEDIINL